MKNIRSYNNLFHTSLLGYALALILSHCVLFSSAVAFGADSTLIVEEISQTKVKNIWYDDWKIVVNGVYRVVSQPSPGNSNKDPAVSEGAYVQYKANITVEGWYKLKHGALPVYHGDWRKKEEDKDLGDRDAMYSIDANSEDDLSITVNQTEGASWESDKSYCFTAGEHSNAFRITTGVHKNWRSNYTYAPPMTLVPDASKNGVSCDGSRDVTIDIEIFDGGYTPSSGNPDNHVTFKGHSYNSDISDTVDYGSQPSYEFTPATGYAIKSITVGETVIEPESGTYTYTFEPVHEDKTISVKFVRANYIIQASVKDSTGGAISPSGDASGNVSVAHGANQTFTFQPNDGFIVSAITVDNNSLVLGDGVSRSGYTFANVQAAHTIGVEFTAGYTIESGFDGGGTVTPAGDVFVSAGEEKGFDITPNSCFQISNVTVDDTSISMDGYTGGSYTYTFPSISANHSIYAQFASSGGESTISAISSQKAQIEPQGKKSIKCIDSINPITYTITYDEDAEDLYIYITGKLPLKILEDGAFTNAAGYTHNEGSRTITFTVSHITTDIIIRLHDVVELADYPLDIVTRPAPPNIMFVLDDSGSMDSEFMTDKQWEGQFHVQPNTGDSDGGNLRRVVFDTKDHSFGDNIILGGNENTEEYKRNNERSMWKSQWFGYNKIYYDPHTTYQPWPAVVTTDENFVKAVDISTEFKAKEHPFEKDSALFDLSAEYMKISDISIPNAHYFIKDGSDIILVSLDYKANPKQIRYYQVTDTSNKGTNTEKATGLNAIDRPSNLGTPNRSFEEEAQNFANWFTFYRKRELTATAAISQVIDQVSNTYIGILSLDVDKKGDNTEGIKQALMPMNVMYLGGNGKFVIKDKKNDLLKSLYSLELDRGMTYLKRGLKKVGEYYDQTDNSDGGLVSEDPESNGPWFSAEEGGACQQSFAIAMTDGYYTNEAISDIDNEDGNNGQPYADTYSETLADIAMYYYEKDLVTSLDDSVPGEVPGEKKGQHMKTYGVAFGVTGTLDPSGYTFSGCTGDGCKDEVTWPNPNSEKAKIDDLFHASVNGRGLYLNASDPLELVEALTNIVNDIADQSGSAASVSVNGDELYSEDSDHILMYQTQYVSPDWVGKVYAYKVNKEDGSVDTENPVWEAGEELDKALSYGASVGSRIIATYKSDDAIPFTWGSLSDTQKGYFENGLEGTIRQDLFNYIRGSNAKESSTLYRVRKGRLGDIVNSGAHYHEGYIYVGANDGMMHAFDAKTGAEKFAYIPSMVLPSLKSLADQTYGDGHRFFVDGTPVVTKMGDKSYLVGGLGKGGKGYYSIDVTNAGTIDSAETLAGKVLWEYPQKDTPQDEVDDLGNTFSKALTVKSYVTDNDKTFDGYVTFFGNGYGSLNGRAALYFLDPQTGELIKKIDVRGETGQNGMGTPVAVDINNDNTMDYIYAGDLEGNMWKFDVRDPNPDNWQVAYCDDGNDNDSCKNSTKPKPLVQTADGQAITASPDITSHPSGTGYMVVFGTGRFLSVSDWDNNARQSFYGIWDFGDDGDDTEYLGKVQSNGQLMKGEATQTFSLLKQTEVYYDVPLDKDGNRIEAEAGADDVEKVRVLSNHEPNWSQIDDPNNTAEKEFGKDPNGHVGWIFDLPLTGERSTVDTIIRDGRAIMISFVLNGDRCAGGAESIVHEIDVYTGGRLSKPAFDVNGDGDFDDDDNVYIGGIPMSPSGLLKPGRVLKPTFVVFDKDVKKYFNDNEGNISGGSDPEADSGLFYWREF